MGNQKAWKALCFYTFFTALCFNATADNSQVHHCIVNTSKEVNLRTDDVIHVEEVGTGKTNPLKVTLSSGIEGVFKKESVSPVSNHRAEIAAYRLDSLLGLGMVPPTVERNINNQSGSLQIWVEGTKTAQELGKTMRELLEMSEKFADGYGRDLKAFDYLIQNRDRSNSGQNVLIHNSGKWVAIDHGYSFITGTTKVPRSVNLTRQMRERLSSISESEIRSQLHDLLNPWQIDELLIRREQLLKK